MVGKIAIHSMHFIGCVLEVARHPQIKYADHCLNGSIQGTVAELPYSGAEEGEVISDEDN